MSAMQPAATPPGQPQPSPSQQGQFIFTGPVPQMPGQPQAPGPHQAQVTGPAQFPQPMMYIPNASVPTSAASASVYNIPGGNLSFFLNINFVIVLLSYISFHAML